MKTILVVDDEPEIASTLQMALEMEGYSVLTASNGHEALAKLHDAPPDLVLSDIMMPFMNGIDLLKAIKTSPALCHIPVVVMSAGRPDPSTIDPHWDAFLPKPLDLDSLLSALGQALSRASGAPS